ncbi:hypothetical protein LA6_001831 [Marinibacterium anthonyi]|nr:hypothetical protein LA6_001831 [Marinibacterium anthonyi]
MTREAFPGLRTSTRIRKATPITAIIRGVIAITQTREQIPRTGNASSRFGVCCSRPKTPRPSPAPVPSVQVAPRRVKAALVALPEKALTHQGIAPTYALTAGTGPAWFRPRPVFALPPGPPCFTSPGTLPRPD